MEILHPKYIIFSENLELFSKRFQTHETGFDFGRISRFGNIDSKTIHLFIFVTVRNCY